MCQVGSCKEGEGMCWLLSRQESGAVVLVILVLLVVIESLIIITKSFGLS